MVRRVRVPRLQHIPSVVPPPLPMCDRGTALCGPIDSEADSGTGVSKEGMRGGAVDGDEGSIGRRSTFSSSIGQVPQVSFLTDLEGAPVGFRGGGVHTRFHRSVSSRISILYGSVYWIP